MLERRTLSREEIEKLIERSAVESGSDRITVISTQYKPDFDRLAELDSIMVWDADNKQNIIYANEKSATLYGSGIVHRIVNSLLYIVTDKAAQTRAIVFEDVDEIIKSDTFNTKSCSLIPTFK